MADRIALLLDGRLEQAGPARDFYTCPASARVARFFGWAELKPGVFFRPELARLHSSAAVNVEGTVEAVVDLGTRVKHTIRLDTGCRCEVEDRTACEPGLRVKVGIASLVSV